VVRPERPLNILAFIPLLELLIFLFCLFAEGALVLPHIPPETRKRITDLARSPLDVNRVLSRRGDRVKLVVDPPTETTPLSILPPERMPPKRNLAALKALEADATAKKKKKIIPASAVPTGELHRLKRGTTTIPTGDVPVHDPARQAGPAAAQIVSPTGVPTGVPIVDVPESSSPAPVGHSDAAMLKEIREKIRSALIPTEVIKHKESSVLESADWMYLVSHTVGHHSCILLSVTSPSACSDVGFNDFRSGALRPGRR